MLKKRMIRTISICLIICLLLNTCQAALYAAPGDPQQQLFEDILNQDIEPSIEEDPSTEAEESKAAAEAEQTAAKEKAILDYRAKFSEPETEYQTHRFIIKYKSGNNENVKQALQRSLGNKLNMADTRTTIMAKKNDENSDKSREEIIETTENIRFSELKEKLQAEGVLDNIEYIQPDYIMDMSSFNDPLLGQQWGHAQNYQPPSPEPDEEEAKEPGILERLFGKSSTPAPYQMDANVIEAWNTSQGTDQLVAILDTGFDLNHPDLKDRIYQNPTEIPDNGLDDDNNGYIDDIVGWDFFNKTNQANDPDNIYDQWHGTHIAGIIAATGNNEQGIAGVAPQAKILPLKVFQGAVAYTSDIIEAISYAEAQGAKIVNCSWGSRYYNPALEEAIANSSMLFVCATGNSLYNLDDYPIYPASLSKTMENVISVASIDQDGRLSRYSNYGPNTVDLAAPGRDIMSTWINNEYNATSGTSMAAAYLTGAAALVGAKDPQQTAAAVKQRLINAGDKVTGLADKITGGKKLNCAYAVSDKTKANTKVIYVADQAITPVIPGEPPEEENMELFGAENYISTKADMPTARYNLEVVAVNDKIYALGGREAGGDSNKIEEYNPQTDTWTTKQNMNRARSEFATAVVNGKIYIIGGRISGQSFSSPINSVEVYDPVANTCTTLAPSGSFHSVGACSATVVGDKIYVIGGMTYYYEIISSDYSNKVYIYDTINNSWSNAPNITIRIAYHEAFYYNGNIYIESGYGSDGRIRTTEYLYNTNTNSPATSSSKARTLTANGASVVTQDRFIGIGGLGPLNMYMAQSTDLITQSNLLEQNTSYTAYYVTTSHMQRPRAGLGAAFLNGKVYITGGYNSNGIFSTLEVMDLGWADKGTLPIAAKNFKTASLDGKLYMAGGEAKINNKNQLINHLYVYDPISAVWHQKDNVPFYGKSFAMTSAYGRIYIFGGETTTTATGTLTVSNKVFAYDPDTNTWSEKAPMRETICFSEALLYNGKIYVTGYHPPQGIMGDIDIRSKYVNVYDPFSDNWSVAQNLPEYILRPFIFSANNTLHVTADYMWNDPNNNNKRKIFVYDQNNNQWTKRIPAGADPPIDACFMIGDILYSIATTDNKTPLIYQYHWQENMWTYYKTFNFFGRINQAVSLNNKAYLFTGSDSYSTHLAEYTPQVTPWVERASLLSAEEVDGNVARAYLGTAVLNDKIYVAGGGTLSFYDKFLEYDESSDVWLNKAPLNLARGFLGLAAANNKLYAMGGRTIFYYVQDGYANVNASKVVEEYNPANNTWSNKKEIPIPLCDMAIAESGGRVYLFGGLNNTWTIQKCVYEYNPATDTWVKKRDMPTARYGCSAVNIGGKIYVVGGFERISTIYGTPLSYPASPTNTLEVYDPSKNTWTTKTAMPVPLGYASVTGRDTLYAVGGNNGSSDSNLVYEYSPELDKWFSWPGPNTTRYAAGAALTSLGLYAIGGRNATGYQSSVEFTPLSYLYSDYLHMGEEEVNLSGNLARNYTDMEYNAPGFKVEFSRTYNSLDDRATSLFSKGWTFGLQGKIDAAGNDVIVRLPKGNGQTFRQNTNGTYTAKDSRSTLVKQSDNTHVLTTKDQYTYGFNTAGYLVWMKDRNGNTVNLTVDSSGKVTRVTDQVGRISSITYTDNRISSISDPAGRVVNYTYNSSGRLTQVADPMGNKTYYAYDSNGYLTSVKDHNSNSIETIAYQTSAGSSELPKIKTITNRYNNMTTYVYEKSEGRLTATDSAEGRINITWFDQMLYPIRTLDPLGEETRTEYMTEQGINKYGEIYLHTDRNGNTTYYDRDTRGNVTKTVNPYGSSKEYTYDDKNNLLSEKDEMGKMTYYTYDSNKINLLKKAQPLNGTDVYSDTATQANFAITSYAYYTDAEILSQTGKTIKGMLKTQTDPAGGITTYTYNSYGTPASIKNPLNFTTNYQYNNLGWLKQETTPKGHTTKYYYDRNGRILKKVLHDGGTERYGYDNQGNLTQKVLPKQYVSGSDTTATYSNNILSSTGAAYSGTAHGYRYVYNTQGLLTKETDPLNFVTSYTYNKYGQKITATQPNSSVYLYEYDKLDRLTKESYKETSTGTTVVLNDYSYAILGDGKTTSTTIQYLNDTQTASTKKTYDYAQRLVRTDNPDNTYTITTYNSNGTITSNTDELNNSTYYQYDGLNREIKKWTPVAGGYSYQGTEYDKACRVTKVTKSTTVVAKDVTPATGLVWTANTYNLGGLLTQKTDSLGGKTVNNYDSDGNLSTQNIYTGSSAYNLTEYEYNHLPKITSKKVYVQNQDINNGSGTTSVALTTNYTYDVNGNLLTETNPDNIKVTYTYDQKNQQLTSSQPGVDQNNAAVTITTSTSYNWAGKVLSQTDPNGKATTYAYDVRNNLVKKTDALSGAHYFVYDRAGRKTAQVAPKYYDAAKSLSQMNRTEYQYDLMSRLLKTTENYLDPDTGAWKSVVVKAATYNAKGQMTLEKDALGNSGGYGTSYEYDPQGNITKIKDPVTSQKGLSHTQQNTYDGLGRLIKSIDANGTETILTYNAQDKLLTQTIGGILQVTNTYDIAGNKLTEKDAKNNTTSYTYNVFYQVRSKTLPGDSTVGSNTTTYQYNNRGLLTRETDSLGKRTQYTYDNQDRVLSQTQQKSDGTQSIVQSQRYDVVGNPIYQVDGNGTTVTNTYDALNRKKTASITITNVSGVSSTQTTTYTYDANGNKTQEANWRGNTYTYVYDPLNRLIEKKDPNNTRIEKLVYNDNNLQTKSIDALDNTTQFTYDRNNRKLNTVNALNYTTKQSYDNIGNIATKTDARGYITNYSYDALKRLTQVTDPLNQSTSYTYDNQGNLLTQTDPMGRVTSYTYNARNLTTKRTDPSVGSSILTEIYTYTAAGKLASKTDRSSIQTTYTYDIHNRMLTQNAGGQQITYTYDNNSNQLTMTDNTGVTTRAYDQLNRVKSKTVPNIGIVTYKYDETSGLSAGQVAQVTTDPKGNTTTKVIDKAGRLYQVKTGSSTVATYAYNANGTRKSLTYPSSIVAEYTYDAANQLKALANKRGATILEAYSYNYDAHGNLTGKTDILGTTSYTYDKQNRLATVIEPSGKQTSYIFDKAGNRSNQTITKGNDTAITGYTYNALNRLERYAQTTTTGTTTNGTQTMQYIYDPNGNQLQSIPDQTTAITAGTTTPEPSLSLGQVGVNAPANTGSVNTYDKYNQLTSIQQDNYTMTNSYNGEGYRVEKTTQQNNATTTSRYLYEYDKVVLEVDQNNNQRAFNLYGTNLISRTADSQTLYYIYNGHGDVTGLVNSSGTIVASYYYDAFGNITSQTGTTSNNIKYAGYQHDQESNLYYLNSRFYDATTARFLQEDTYRGNKADPLSLNLYTYCSNDPMMYYDPSGHGQVWNKYGEVIGTTSGPSYTDRSQLASNTHGGGAQANKPWTPASNSSSPGSNKSSTSNSNNTSSSGGSISSNKNTTFVGNIIGTAIGNLAGMAITALLGSDNYGSKSSTASAVGGAIIGATIGGVTGVFATAMLGGIIGGKSTTDVGNNFPKGTMIASTSNDLQDLALYVDSGFVPQILRVPLVELVQRFWGTVSYEDTYRRAYVKVNGIEMYYYLDDPDVIIENDHIMMEPIVFSETFGIPFEEVNRPYSGETYATDDLDWIIPGGGIVKNVGKSAVKTGIEEIHHLLPQQFKNQFKKAGLDIEDYKIPLDKATHRLKPDGLHTGPENWNKQWKDFFDNNPAAGSNEILNQLERMKKIFELD